MACLQQGIDSLIIDIMKTLKVILSYIAIIVLFSSSYTLFAQIPSSGTFYLSENITLSKAVSVSSGQTLTIINNTDKDITISGGNVSTMFTNNGTLILQGNPNGRIIIDGGAEMGIVSTTKIEELSFTVPDGIKKRIAIRTNSSFKMEYVTIQNVHASGADGAALYLSIPKNQKAEISNCTITKCYAERGSALMISSGSVGDIYVEDSHINYCFSGKGSSQKTGGAIRTYGSTKSSLYLTNVTFRYNRAFRIKNWNNDWERDGSGGAIFWNARGLEDTKCSIDGCLFEYNVSDDNGGAIKTQASIEFVGKKTYIQNNVAPVGAGLYIEGYIGGSTTPKRDLEFNLSSSLVIKENRAPSYLTNDGVTISGLGAGIHLWFSSNMDLEEGSRIFVTMNGAIVEGNKAEGPDAKGGGIYFENSSKPGYYDFFIFLNDGKVLKNTSEQHGGGIYVYEGDVSYDETIAGGKLEINNNNAINGAGIFIQNGDLSIRNGDITENKIEESGNGAGVHINNGEMTLVNGSIMSNTIAATGNGGGIYIENGDFTIHSGNISSNTLNNGNGGGIYIHGSKTGDVTTGNFTMNGGSITSNTASGDEINTGYGGGTYVNGGNFTLTAYAIEGEISNNASSKDGGGVYINGGQFVQNAGAISSNVSNGNGAGVCIVNGGTFTMSGGNITGNGKEGSTPKTQNGGGVYLNGGNFTLDGDGEISSNAAIENGGGVFLTGDNCIYELQKGNITGNSAGKGGGVYLEKGLFKLGTSGNILEGNISSNTATYGGGVYIGSGNVSPVSDEIPAEPTEGFIMYGGTITSNSTDYDGGGIYLDGGSFLMNNGDIISNSSASEGGGVCIVNNGNFTMNDGDITGNGKNSDGGVVTHNGGGVYLDGGTLTVASGTISSNASTINGGGLYIMNGAVRMGAGIIQGNICGEYGGGVYVFNSSAVDQKTVDFNGGTLSGNSAKYGGGVCVNGLILMTIENVEIAENSATNGGGVCLMNSAHMVFGRGQIKNNTAFTQRAFSTGYQKEIDEIEGFGGGVYLSTNTTLVFNYANDLGLFGNLADNGGDEIFANGKSTTVDLPDVTYMALGGYPGASNLKWIEDYPTNDGYYNKGTKLKGDAWDTDRTNLRYRETISQNAPIYNLSGATTQDTRYICFSLGYEVIYISVTRYGLGKGESAIYRLHKNEANDFMIILTGDGSETVTKKAAVTAGEWTVSETDWSWGWILTDEEGNPVPANGITKDIADDANRIFIFKGTRQTGIPMNSEDVEINIMGI